MGLSEKYEVNWALLGFFALLILAPVFFDFLLIRPRDGYIAFGFLAVMYLLYLQYRKAYWE